jgi:SAM-dependent methyltransferase
MLFLSEEEITNWSELARQAVAGTLTLARPPAAIRPRLWPHFCLYIGSLLAKQNRLNEARDWLAGGARNESVSMNRYLLDYIGRHGGLHPCPEPVFADPRPYLHFTTITPLREARERFIAHAAASLPRFGRPLRLIDMGCGDGGLTRALLEGLRDYGNAVDIEEIILVDPSENMLQTAREVLVKAFPETRIASLNGRSEALAAHFPPGLDIALSSLAWHHMTYDTKRKLARQVAERVDHVLLFEIEGNHDTPELNSPELAVSAYQLYGAAVRMVMTQEAPREIIEACLDHFLMGELLSLLTEPRGQRSEYHMLRRQWHALLREGLGPKFECRADFTCWCDDLSELFMLHYGKRRCDGTQRV